MASEQAQACQEIRCLKEKLAYQNEQTCRLKEKLAAYDVLENKNIELQKEFDKLKEWVDDVAKHENKTKEDMLSNLEDQRQKLCQSKLTECKLQTENKKLHEDIDCMKERIENHKKTEQKHCMEIEDLEMHRNRVLNDLCTAKTEIEEKSNLLEFSKNQLKCKESKYCNMKCQLDECNTACGRLREECTDLKSELACNKTELAATKSHAALTEQKLKLDRDRLSNEADAERKKIHVLEIDFSEAKRTIVNDMVKIRKLDALVMGLREASEKDRCDMNNRVQKYKKELCAKEEVLNNVKNQMGALQDENECIAVNSNTLKKQLNDAECKLENLKKDNKQLESDKKSMCCDLEEKTRKIAALENEACALRDGMKKLETEVCALQGKINELESEVCALQGKINELESEVCALQGKINELESEVCQLKDKNKELEQHNCALNEKIGDLERQLCALKNKCRDQEPPTQCSQPSPVGSSERNVNKCSPCNEFINELKELYCSLQEIRQNAKSCMTKN